MSRESLIDELAEIWKDKCSSCGQCCKDANCFARKGYFEGEEAGRFEAVKDKFDSAGFLGENGCRLSKYERSFTCITYLCPQAVRKIPQIERNLFAMLTNELKSLEGEKT